MKPSKTIKCPKDPENNYFVEICRTVFQKAGFRPWCKTCHHFVESGTQKMPPPAGEDKEASS